MKTAGSDTRDQAVSGQRQARKRPDGFAYLALLAAIAIIGIALSGAGKYWQYIVQREKEEELLFRGRQYSHAIERYYLAIPGKQQYPENIDDLLVDNRTAIGKRHLRQRYKDPMTGDDFVEIRDQKTRRIIGVHSPSNKQPLKQADFPEEFKDFAGKSMYSDWQFVFVRQQPPPQQPGVPGQHPRPGTPEQPPPPGQPR